MNERTRIGTFRWKICGTQSAHIVDLGVEWDVGAPSPRVISSEGRTAVTFSLPEPTPAIDPSIPAKGGITLIPPSELPFGVIIFDRVWQVRFGFPRGEATQSHHLFGRGLEMFAAHEVRDSAWLASVGHTLSRDPDVDHDVDAIHHYILTFHDSILEVLAGSARSRVIVGFPQDVRGQVSRDLANL